MAVTVNIYSNANATSKTVTFDFVGDVLAADHDTPGPYSPSNVASVEYYFKITTGATQDNNASYPVKIVRSLGELVLNGNNQSALHSGDANAYSDIKSMIVDYVWDYINGHADNEYGSGVSEQRPMKFR